jgi:alkyl hydroperoxide reductase subunit AhpF
MKAADKITLGKAIRFARMSSQALDHLLEHGDLTEVEKKQIIRAEGHATDAALLAGTLE